MRILLKLTRAVLTLAMLAAAVLLVAALWQRYMLAPWTRDGRVRAEVVDVAPEVSGTVVDVPVTENQFVHRGDVLFALDPIRFKLAIAQAQAAVDSAKQQLALSMSDARRRKGLTGVVSAEEQERTQSSATVAGAQLESAQAALDIAKLNLERSVLHSPVNGYVTNLRLRIGDYANAAQPKVAVIDADSFWISGYFEETKLSKLHPGDPARIELMGFTPILTGHIDTIARGINDRNSSPDGLGLQDVNPVFTWVRLAQRVPVRIHIDSVPDGVVLAAGTTCSISVGPDAAPPDNPIERFKQWLQGAL